MPIHGRLAIESDENARPALMRTLDGIAATVKS